MKRKVLFLAGSPTDDFHANLSRVYARDCLIALDGLASYEFTIAWISPDGIVCFPRSFDGGDIDNAAAYSLVEACRDIVDHDFDAVVPQMFCAKGMTDYRALIETLGIPLVGNPSNSMAITLDKAKSRAIAQSAGIPIPPGTVLHDGDDLSFVEPVVVKPARADNSHGVSLVTSANQLDAAIENARQFDRKVIAEHFVPLGREVRCATLVRDGGITCLPLQEYQLDAEAQPIRDEASKLSRSSDGTLDLTSKHRCTSWIVDADDPVTSSVWSIARQCHDAFECRDYGLFDFRIDPRGQPFFLEAGLYNSFAPNSIVVAVADAAGIKLDDLFGHCVDLAVTRDQRRERNAVCDPANLCDPANHRALDSFTC